MPVEVINRWECALVGSGSDASLSVNSIDCDKTLVKIRLGTVERIVSVGDWMGLISAVGAKIEQYATSEATGRTWDPCGHRDDGNDYG
jgi:hypothetical protein